MKRNQLLLFSLLVFFSANTQAQDTVKVMHYNLLYYGVNNSWCNQTNNNIQLKNASLRNIIAFAQPDIFTVNEISSNVSFHDMILDSALNIQGVTKFKRAGVTNFSGTSIVNQLYYDSEKFGIRSEYALVGGDRDINVYKLYYKTPELQWSTDTVFVTFFVAHLSSGTGSQNELNRDNEVAIVQNHLATLPKPGNYIFQGDFNFYASSEAGFQRIINNANADVRFYDPINKIGTWTNNPTYAAYHTQSTHTVGDCFIGGGLDDRFDFIMVNMPVLMETLRVKYVPGSYVTLGQDGLHFDKALTDPPVNNSAPANVIQALYDLSDHLPVMLDLRINQTPASVEAHFKPQVQLVFENPVKDKLQGICYSAIDQNIKARIIDLSGRHIWSENLQLYTGANDLQIPLQNVSQGVYIMHIYEESRIIHSYKIIKL